MSSPALFFEPPSPSSPSSPVADEKDEAAAEAGLLDALSGPVRTKFTPDDTIHLYSCMRDLLSEEDACETLTELDFNARLYDAMTPRRVTLTAKKATSLPCTSPLLLSASPIISQLTDVRCVSVCC